MNRTNNRLNNNRLYVEKGGEFFEKHTSIR